MPCEHSENDDIATEKLKLTTLVTRAPTRLAATAITLHVDGSETHEQLKLDALEDAMNLVAHKTGQRLNGLEVFLGAPCRCIAYLGERGGDRSYAIFLGDQMLHKTAATSSEKVSGIKGGHALTGGERGVADQVYDAKRKSTLNPSRWLMGETAYQASKVNAKAIAVIVHEFGHVLHEANDTAKYWKLKRQWGEETGLGDRPPADIAVRVSQYATKSKLEFAAEVFTGLIYGQHYHPDVLNLYTEYGGIAVA